MWQIKRLVSNIPVGEGIEPDETPATDDGPGRRRPFLLVLLAVVLFAEAALLVAATVLLFYELVVDRAASYASALGILILAALAAVWLVMVAVSTLRARPWIRGAAIVWQVLQIGVGIGSLQGLLAREDIGWFLIIPAVLALVLLFTRPVLAATMRQDV